MSLDGKFKSNSAIGVTKRVIRASKMMFMAPDSKEVQVTDYLSYKNHQLAYNNNFK